MKVAKTSPFAVPKQAPPLPKEPPPVILPKPNIPPHQNAPPLPSPTKSSGSGQSSSPPSLNKRGGLFSPPLSLVKSAEVVPLSPTKRTPPAVPVRHPTTALSGADSKANRITVANTRKIGQKITIILKKGLYLFNCAELFIYFLTDVI